MDRQLLERMVGAAVLIIALVVIAPAILDGPGDQEPALPDAGGSLNRDVRTVTLRPDRQAAEPPVAVPGGLETPAAAAAAPPPPPQPKPKAEPKPTPKTEPARDPAPKAVGKAPAPPPAARPAQQPAPKPAAVRSGWAVQLGSFASQDNAQRLAGEVSAKGYATYLLPLEKGGRTLYRVRVGPRPSRAAAEELAGELAKAGYKGQVAREGQAT